jgi:3-methylcrotonyl-CoA carboxylase alpha subunit
LRDEATRATRAEQGQLTAPLSGRVVSVAVQDGEAVRAGATLLVVEAMKMEHRIVAPRDGTVRLRCAAGDLVAQGAELLELA